MLCLQRPSPPTILIRHKFNCYISKGEIPKSYLTNHKGSISHHTTPLVINSLGGGHTHIHTYSHHGQKQFQEASHAPAKGQHMPGLKSKETRNNILT